MTADPYQPALDELVRRTTGFRPWRKLFHAVNGLAIAGVLTYGPLARWQAAPTLGAVLAVLLVLDIVRLRIRAANRLFFRVFGRLASPREAIGIASSTWYVLGIFLAVALFPMPEAISAILVLAVADPAASWTGSRLGGRPFLGGTLSGTLVFFVVASVVLVLRHEPVTALATASIVTFAERRAWPLDDNLAIPVVCAGLLTAFAAVA